LAVAATLALSVTPVASGTAPVGAAPTGYFKTPSGNIVCFYVAGKNADPALVLCGIKSGLEPATPHRSCNGDGGYASDRVVLLVTGRANAPRARAIPGRFSG
jgi:hypothetical protein